MAERYCWICDEPVDEDPCPRCGTPLYSRPEPEAKAALPDEVLDTAREPATVSTVRSPVLIGLVAVAVLIVIVLVFQAVAGIS